MSRAPMLDNILGQPESHRGVLALQRTQQSLVQACAERIRATKGRIVFTGMGGSLFAIFAAVTRLAQQGYAAAAWESAELLHYEFASLRAGDLGVIVSRSGGSIEPVLLAEKMRHLGMTVIAVTNVPGSKLEEIADLTLSVGSLSDNLIAVQTYTGTVLALLLLAEEVIAGGSAQLSEECAAALPTLTSHIDACVQASDQWQPLLSGTLYLLGRGAALGSVHEGALLMHETAKTAAVGMSSGQFRHGPAEIVSPEFRAVVFGSPSTTTALDRALADDLSSAGGQVYWIGPGAGRAPSLVSWPDIPLSLAPLFEIVPMQVAAYRLALWRNITPGDFHYVSEVTSTESGFKNAKA